MEVLNDGKFVYGSHQSTYICNDFNPKLRESIVHDYDVMKIKKYNNSKIIEATTKKIYLTDLNNRKF